MLQRLPQPGQGTIFVVDWFMTPASPNSVVKQRMVSVAFSTSESISVQVSGESVTPAGTVAAGVELPLGVRASNRRPFVETAGGTRLAYDIGAKHVQFSLPGLRYRLRYRGFDVVLTARIRD